MNADTHILVADDDPIFGRSLVETLRCRGYACDWAPCGHSAAERLAAQRYDLLIADIHMPGNSGLELIAGLEHHADAPAVVLVTGDPQLESAVGGIRLGVSAYWYKPVQLDIVLHDIERVIGQRQKEQRAKAAVEALRDFLSPAGPSASPAASGLCAGDSRRDPLEGLSDRERQVVELFANLPDVKGVAGSLGISPYTVKNHLHSAYRKLGVSSQAGLLAFLQAQSDADSLRP